MTSAESEQLATPGSREIDIALDEIEALEQAQGPLAWLAAAAVFADGALAWFFWRISKEGALGDPDAQSILFLMGAIAILMTILGGAGLWLTRRRLARRRSDVDQLLGESGA